jgi:hypothetical protein
VVHHTGRYGPEMDLQHTVLIKWALRVFIFHLVTLAEQASYMLIALGLSSAYFHLAISYSII